MATAAHCHYCFDVLASHLEGRPVLSLARIEELFQKQQQKQQKPPATINGHSKSELTNHVSTVTSTLPKTPLFVTWKKLSSSGHLDLRGCIGTFDPKPLESGLKDYALTAGLHDTRFDPITTRELPRLECGVTLLTNFEPAVDAMDWTLGTHGLQIDFVYHHRRMGATYLPDVPEEQGWTKEETLVSLMRKAGWTGKRDEWRKVALRVTRYRGSKATVSYGDYQGLLKVGEGDDEEDEDEENEYVLGKGSK
ncbi:AMMECR1 domain-containing protein [Trichophaea hybrida]|nr:AMMECR1 domain-containing protein [Trichophaea hybrida]